MRQYLEDRFQIHSPELTTDEFLDLVSASPDLSRVHQQLLRPFLRRADLVKFAHHRPDASEVEDSVDVARRFLEETRDNAPMIDVGDPAAASEVAARDERADNGSSASRSADA